MSDVFLLLLFYFYSSMMCLSAVQFVFMILTSELEDVSSHVVHLVNRHEQVSVYRLHAFLWITRSHCFQDLFIFIDRTF